MLRPRGGRPLHRARVPAGPGLRRRRRQERGVRAALPPRLRLHPQPQAQQHALRPRPPAGGAQGGERARGRGGRGQEGRQESLRGRVGGQDVDHVMSSEILRGRFFFSLFFQCWLIGGKFREEIETGSV